MKAYKIQALSEVGEEIKTDLILLLNMTSRKWDITEEGDEKSFSLMNVLCSNENLI